MPNWVKHEITISGNVESLRDLMDKVRTSESEFDFNGIIPMPKALDVDSGTVTDEALICFLTHKGTMDWAEIGYLGQKILRESLSFPSSFDSYLKRIKERPQEDLDKCYEQGRQYYTNYKEYGSTTWYDWCVSNWGTKWNACEPFVDYHGGDFCRIYFDTAWSAPIPIFEKMHEMYPDLDIVVLYADEDLGNNCGTWINGVFTEPDDPVEFASELWDYDGEDYDEIV